MAGHSAPDDRDLSIALQSAADALQHRLKCPNTGQADYGQGWRSGPKLNTLSEARNGLKTFSRGFGRWKWINQGINWRIY